MSGGDPHAASLDVNRAYWDERAPAHAASPDYNVDDFIADPALISDVVRFDLPRLGDITGARGLHLQCHIGTDTLSLARLGAQMSGLDLSAASVTQARRLAAATNTEITYVVNEVFRATDEFAPGSFDLVFTGIGALCWLPSIDRWAATVAALLRPGGRLFLREGHPMLWALDTDAALNLVVRFPYFEVAQPTVFDEDGTYVATDRSFTTTVTHEWNHGLAETITALMRHGLELVLFEEHTSIPWRGFDHMVPADAPGEFTLPEHPERVALSYTLVARKR